MKNNKLKYLTTAAVIAALYVALTLPLGTLASSSFINIRPSEALTILPLLLPEAIPGLFVGCLLSNLLTGATPLDTVLGAVITLIAALLTRFSRKVWLGGIPPVLLNALLLPLIWVLMGAEGTYFVMAASVLCTQAIWVYGLGVPLYYTLKRTRFVEKVVYFNFRE